MAAAPEPVPAVQSGHSRGWAPIPRHGHTDYTTRYRCTCTNDERAQEQAAAEQIRYKPPEDVSFRMAMFAFALLPYLPDDSDDYAIHTHGNGMAVLTLAPTHPLRRLKKTVVSVSWQGVSTKPVQVQDRSKAKVTGKRKKGGQFLEPTAVLCQVECSDGSYYKLRASVHGKLVEVNESLGRRAQLMVDDASWEGYLALFMLAARAKSMLSVEDRSVEGSEAERDLAETMQLKPVEEAEMDASKADGNTPVTLEAQEAAQKEGRSWQSTITYLTPAEYVKKRSAMFVTPASG